MRDTKPINWDAKKISFFLIPLGVLFFVLAVIKGSGFLMGLCIFLTVACLGAGVFLLYRDYARTKNRVNYFLYDARRHRRIPEAEFDFAVADDRLGQFVAAFTDAPLTLWNGIPKGMHLEMQAKPGFRPLVCYKMLHELSVLPPAELTEIFFEADERTVAYVCRAIRDAGDEDMADIIFKMKRHGENEEKRIVAFFTKNKTCFETRIMRYIHTHREDFIIDVDRKGKEKTL